jgi:Ca2+-transporting ATPase
MTARELIVVGSQYSVEGEGYSTEGRSSESPGETETSLDPFLLPMALANDAAVRDGEIVGDPTEAALVVWPAKGRGRRRRDEAPLPACRRGPFDSEYKFMATFHEMEDDGARSCAATSRARPTCCSPARRTVRACRRRRRPRRGHPSVLAENDRLAGEGLRCSPASRDIDPATLRPGGACSTRCRT